MKAPRLDRKLCILKRTVVRDAAGFPYETWEIFGTIWAGLERITANEQERVMQTRATRAEKFITRFSACLNEPTAPGDYRIRYAGRDYNLVSAVEDTSRERMKWIILLVGYIEGQPTLTTADVPA